MSLFYRSAPVTAEGRTLVGLALPFDHPQLVRDMGGPEYLEEFTRTAFDVTLRERAEPFPLFVDHRRSQTTDPIGAVEFRRSAEGLIYEAPLSRTPDGDKYLTLVNDGAMRDVSVGGKGIRQKIRRASVGDVLSRTEVKLLELSLAPTGFGQYPQSKVLMVRSVDSSFDSITDAVKDAVELAVFGAGGPPEDGPGMAWVEIVDIGADWCVIEVHGVPALDPPVVDGELVKYGYTVDDAGAVTLGEPVPVVRTYAPVARSSSSSSTRLLAGLDPAAQAFMRAGTGIGKPIMQADVPLTVKVTVLKVTGSSDADLKAKALAKVRNALAVAGGIHLG